MLAVKEITSRQREVLVMISGYAAAHGYAPSMREIMVAFGWHSTRSVLDHLRALEKNGAITRRPGAARTIRIILP